MNSLSRQRNKFTKHQLQYFAHLITLEGQTEETISRSISSAKVDMNPHQVDAALFALRSPLSKGVILADEVGLGKTIEASLVIAQRWAEKKRNILLIVPATLRKQWAQELAEKFALPCEIIEAKNYNQAIKAGKLNPFDQSGKILIASYQFAARKTPDIKAVNWGVVIFDEAHKLRNIYKKGTNRTAKALCEAVRDRSKVLLTATPLQNSLMELYGLMSVIDENFFGSESAFRSQFMAASSTANLSLLKARLKNACARTLRRQVAKEGGIRFTQRHSLTQPFTPSDDEQKLYRLVSEYLQRDNIAAIQRGARHLVILVIRKLLASSSFAIGDTLKKMIDRLERELGQDNAQATISPEDLDDYDTIEETAEEIEGDEDTPGFSDDDAKSNQALKKEIAELKEFRALAQSIKENAKGDALIRALKSGFDKTEELGGLRKAVIFTESVRTQKYLKELLSANGYEGKLVLMNGSNTDPDSQAVYRSWVGRHKGTDVISGSKSADTKAAIVESFKNDSEILIATESGAEGINLQFCSLVINYDLPWNPQRVEQRIGRCHRYGQKSDVVVVNFINEANAADRRVFQLLDRKFRLFEGVFGASDEVLGALESGVDIEQRILAVFQQCKSTAEIEERFCKLEEELSESLEAREVQARQALLENVDEAVIEKLRFRRGKLSESLNEFEKKILPIICGELPEAEFISDKAFQYEGQVYSLDWKEAEANGWNFFRLEDESLAERIINQAKERTLEPVTVCFEYERYDGGQLADLTQFRNQSGWLTVSKLKLSSLQDVEHLVVSAVTDEGETLDDQQCKRLLCIPAQEAVKDADGVPVEILAKLFEQQRKTLIEETNKNNKQFFDEETEKLDTWADEAKRGVQAEIDSLEKEIKAAKKLMRSLSTLEEKTAEKRRIKQLEAQRTAKKRAYFETEEKVDAEQEKLLDEIEARMEIKEESQALFMIRWQLV